MLMDCKDSPYADKLNREIKQDDPLIRRLYRQMEKECVGLQEEVAVLTGRLHPYINQPPEEPTTAPGNEVATPYIPHGLEPIDACIDEIARVRRTLDQLNKMLEI